MVNVLFMVNGESPGRYFLLSKPPATKLLRVMKLLTILMTAVCLQINATGLTQTVSLSLKGASMETAFREIERQTQSSFVYGKEQLAAAKPVDLSVKNEKLETVLALLFKGQELEYSISGKYIVVRQKVKSADNGASNLPPPVTIKGRVVDEEGMPVVAASVQLKGTNRGTSTNDNGEFELKDVDQQQAVLVISGVSIQNLELNVIGKSNLGNITVKIKAAQGQEIKIEVNTGYQKVRPQNFVGSYSQLDSAGYNSRPGTDILSRLDGMVSGILFDKKSPATIQLRNIQIRGLSTLSMLQQSASVQPLVIVDNFPFKQDLSTINQNDIENITVLKDAAATSIWGAQAGNGVIVITTKKGKYNQPVQVSASSTITVQSKPDPYYYPQMTVSEVIDMEILLFNKGVYDTKLANNVDWPWVTPVVELLDRRRAGKVTALDSADQITAFRSMDLRRDLDKWVYRSAVAQQHYVNMSGGNNLISYGFSAGYNRSLNNIQGTKPDDQITLSTNTGIRPIKGMDINMGINYTYGKAQSTGFSLPPGIYPYAQLADPFGTSLAIADRYRTTYLDTVGAGKLLDWKYRPLDEIRSADTKNSTRALQLYTGISYRFTNWLSARVAYQYNNQSNTREAYYGLQTYAARSLINTFTNLSASTLSLRNPVPIGAILDVGSGESRSQNFRSQLDFNKTFAGQHVLTGLLAAERSETKTSGYSSRFYGFDKEVGTSNYSIDYQNLFPVFNTTTKQQIPNDNRRQPLEIRRFVSLVGNVSYTYGSRYTLYGSVRKDGSNIFGVRTNEKWKPLWSTGAAWTLSGEKFFHVKWVSSLKLRASYGYSGNPTSASGLPSILYRLVPNALTGLADANLNIPPNPDLRWEKVAMLNEGVEFSLWNGKLAGSFDVFQKKSTDIYGNLPTAPSTGVSLFPTNVASLKANGFELALRSTNIDRTIKWFTSFNLSHSKTIVTDVFFNVGRVRTLDFVQYGLNPAPGQIAYGLSSYKWGGLDPLTGDPRGYKGKQLSTDYNAILNDSISNQVFNGSAIPLYFGNIGNTIRWKNFSLTANITYRLDFYFRKPTISYSDLPSLTSLHADFAKRWQQPGDELLTNVPSFSFPFNSQRDQFYQLAEVNVLRGDNVKLSDIGISYSWKPGRKYSLIKDCQLFVAANQLNVILWRKDKSGYDPDITGGTGIVFPPSKTWSAKLMLRF